MTTWDVIRWKYTIQFTLEFHNVLSRIPIENSETVKGGTGQGGGEVRRRSLSAPE